MATRTRPPAEFRKQGITVPHPRNPWPEFTLGLPVKPVAKIFFAKILSLPADGQASDYRRNLGGWISVR